MHETRGRVLVLVLVLVRRSARGGERYGGKRMVVTQEIVLRNPELKIEHIEKLAFDPTDIAFPKHTRANRPMDVFERRVIQIL